MIVPAIGEVAAFPLVALAMQENSGGAKPSAMEMLNTLERHLPFTRRRVATSPSSPPPSDSRGCSTPPESR